MATGWSRDTSNPNNFSQTNDKSVSGSSGSNVSGSSSSSGSQNTSVNMSNISQTGSSVLDQLLLQLSDHPNVSTAQLDEKAPLPVQKFVPNGRVSGAFGEKGGGGQWVWIDPLNGRTLNADDAQKVMTERQAQRDKITKDSGVTPGGTVVQRANQVARDQTVSSILKAQGDYSKQAAYTDVQGLITQQLQQLNDKNMSEITRSAEGAGTSASSVRTLMINDAQTKAAQAVSALGVKTAVDYGNVAGNFDSILQNLTLHDPVTEALLQALGVAKGAVQQGSTSVQTQQQQQTEQQTNTNTSQNDIDEIIRKATANGASKAFIQQSSNFSDLSDTEQGVTF